MPKYSKIIQNSSATTFPPTYLPEGLHQGVIAGAIILIATGSKIDPKWSKIPKYRQIPRNGIYPKISKIIQSGPNIRPKII